MTSQAYFNNTTYVFTRNQIAAMYERPADAGLSRIYVLEAGFPITH